MQNQFLTIKQAVTYGSLNILLNLVWCFSIVEAGRVPWAPGFIVVATPFLMIAVLYSQRKRWEKANGASFKLGEGDK